MDRVADIHHTSWRKRDIGDSDAATSTRTEKSYLINRLTGDWEVNTTATAMLT